MHPHVSKHFPRCLAWRLSRSVSFRTLCLLTLGLLRRPPRFWQPGTRLSRKSNQVQLLLRIGLSQVKGMRRQIRSLRIPILSPIAFKPVTGFPSDEGKKPRRRGKAIACNCPHPYGFFMRFARFHAKIQSLFRPAHLTIGRPNETPSFDSSPTTVVLRDCGCISGPGCSPSPTCDTAFRTGHSSPDCHAAKIHL